MTKIFTHDGPRAYEVTDVRMIVAAKLPEGFSDDWYEIDAEEVETYEALSGAEYPKLKGLTKLWVEGYGKNEVTRWGYL